MTGGRTEPCPDCEHSIWGPGAVDDPLSNAAGGRPWATCWTCKGSGLLQPCTRCRGRGRHAERSRGSIGGWRWLACDTCERTGLAPVATPDPGEREEA